MKELTLKIRILWMAPFHKGRMDDFVHGAFR